MYREVAAVIILDMCLGVLGIYEVLLLCFQCQADYRLIIIIVKNKRFRPPAPHIIDISAQK